MTLGDFFSAVNSNPYYIVFYFLAIPFAAFLGNIFAKGEGHQNPWCVFYASLIYMVAIPGIFSLILNIYHMLFENISIYDANIFSQILPIISMAVTFILIKQNVDFDQIPGFGKLTGFISTVTAVMLIMFILNKMHLIAFTYVKFHYIILMLVGLFILIRYGTRFLFK